jgi:hypothetical protein
MPAVTLPRSRHFHCRHQLRAQQKADSNETLKIGLIGCGGRGTGAAAQALGADYNAKLVAMADAFDTQIENSIKNLSTQFPDRVDVKPDKKFTGLDAYQKLIDTVWMSSCSPRPPGFRPHAPHGGRGVWKAHLLREADGRGCRRLSRGAGPVRRRSRKKINLVAGFCWRYSAPAASSAYKRVHDGQIGDISSILPPTTPGRSNPCRQPRAALLAWVTSSGRCATGTTSPGSAVTASSSRPCTASIKSAGP